MAMPATVFHKTAGRKRTHSVLPNVFRDNTTHTYTHTHSNTHTHAQSVNRRSDIGDKSSLKFSTKLVVINYNSCGRR